MHHYEFTPCSDCKSPMACRDVGQCVGAMTQNYNQIARRIEANTSKPQSELKNLILEK